MAAPGYYPDLAAFSLAKLKQRFRSTRLLPSQKILGESLDERFACLEQNGIENLAQLQKALKNKAAITAFAQTSGLPIEYLNILRREVNSYLPEPASLKEFPGVNLDAVRKLQEIGVTNTEQLFPHVLTPEKRGEFARQYQIEEAALLELTRLTDLARLKWVGPKFARLLLEAGYDTVEKIAHSDGEALYHDLVTANEASRVYQGKLGLEDIKLWVATAVQETPQVIQY
jgi:hypothetical protein